MRTTIEPRGPRTRPNWWRRIGWFALIYVASFTVVVSVAYGLKLVIPH